jgi:hypothetical protein
MAQIGLAYPTQRRSRYRRELGTPRLSRAIAADAGIGLVRLLGHGAAIDARDEESQTPRHVAAGQRVSGLCCWSAVRMFMRLMAVAQRRGITPCGRITVV